LPSDRCRNNTPRFRLGIPRICTYPIWVLIYFIEVSSHKLHNPKFSEKINWESY
jgi:hypothetical protein